MKTLCLNMIVKNEIKIIKRCFDSIVDYIDYWVICDTGSTDGTQKFIRNYFKEKNIKGELHEVHWVNFGFNRQQSIQKSYKKADYIILLDADFTVVINDKNFKDKLHEPQYLIRYDSNSEYYNIKLVSANYLWKYEGVTHEYIYNDILEKSNSRSKIFNGFYIKEYTDGSNRTLEKKFKRDIELLEKGIKEEPNNSRYYFYLANSYKDINDYDKALYYYKKRMNMDGYNEEKYMSMYTYAKIKEKLGIDKEILIPYFLESYKLIPTRFESIYEIIKYYRIKGDYKKGYDYGKLILKNIYQKNKHFLFVNKYILEIGILDELSICAFYVKDYRLSLTLINRILFNKNIISKIANDEYKRITENKNLALSNIEFNKKIVEKFEIPNDNENKYYFLNSPLQLNCEDSNDSQSESIENFQNTKNRYYLNYNHIIIFITILTIYLFLF